MKRAILLVCFLLCVKLGYGQQTAQYSQYIFNAIYVNPAYAGHKERVNLNATYRNQWTGINGAPDSFSMAVDGTINDDNVGLALQVSSDKIGAQTSMSAFANYAYRLPVTDDYTKRLAFGFGVGVFQSSLNGDMLYGNDLGDLSIPQGAVRELAPDVRLGIFYSTPKYYLGASADNLVSKVLVDRKVRSFNFPTPKPHYYLMGGAVMPLIDFELDFKPSFLIKDDIKGPTVLDLNAFFLLKQRLWIGAGYRTNIKLYNKSNLVDNLQTTNALIGMAEVFVSDTFRFGYSYDYSMGSLAGYSGSTHEISVGIYLRTNKEKREMFCYF